MKKGILIGIAVVITTLLLMGAIQKGRGYMYSVRVEGETTSMCVTPGDWHVYTVTFGIGVKNVDYPMLLIDLDDVDENWPHKGVSAGHIHILSISTSINVNGTFAGNVSIGYLSDVTATNSRFNPVADYPFNAYLNLAVQSYKDYAFHPIGCKTTDTIGPAETLTAFQSDVFITIPSAGSIEPGNGDVVLWIDRGAGNITMSGVIQYTVVPD